MKETRNERLVTQKKTFIKHNKKTQKPNKNVKQECLFLPKYHISKTFVFQVYRQFFIALCGNDTIC
jgi:hypothetical protein